MKGERHGGPSRAPRETGVVAAPIESPIGRIAPGRVAAQRFVWQGLQGGEPVIGAIVNWFMGSSGFDRPWSFGERGPRYEAEVRGDPSLSAAFTGCARARWPLASNATRASFLLSQRLAPMMVETAGGGAIVNVSSRCADLAQGAFVAYGAGKATLNMMTRNMAIEFAPKVRVNAIGVGGVGTDSLKLVLTDEALAREFLDNTPMGRAGTPEDIAACALYLASPASSWVTGKVFDVDGGTESVSVRVPTPPL